MNVEQNVSFIVAFFAGLLSFFSPCILPLIPAYVSFVTGVSLKHPGANGAAVAHSLAFVTGFSAVFVIFGASATLLGQLLLAYQREVRLVGGIIVIIFGIYLTGAVRMPFLSFEKKMTVRRKPAGLIGSFLVGTAFAAGWTPCVGPILASILLVASTAGSIGSGIALLSLYSLGLAVPFVLTSLAVDRFVRFFESFRKYQRAVSVVSGVFLIFVGAMMII